jgi:hypothetical protein
MTPLSISSTDLGTLSQSLGFTVEQMVLNRSGAVSPDQMRGFGWLVLRNAVMVLVLVGASFIIAAVVKVWWRWISVAILVALAAFFGVRAIGEIRDLSAPQALSVEGKPEFFGGHRNTVTMRIGGKDFIFNTDVPEEKKPWNLIQTDRTYRVYFLRHSGRPLSMEPDAP